MAWRRQRTDPTSISTPNDMANKYETSVYTQKQMDSARVRGQVKGWVQGAVSTFLFLLLLKFLGWIPAIIILGLIGYMGYRIFSAEKKPPF